MSANVSAAQQSAREAHVAEMAGALGFALGPEQVGLLAAYLSLLTAYNKRMNLVGPADAATIFETLVVDSLYLAEFLPGLGLPESPLCLDLGAGAGLPGIPLRICWQEGEYVLVEARQKRCSFMRTALGRLKLPSTRVFEGRAESAPEWLAAQGLPRRAELILSRAFMPWERLLPFAEPMLAPGGALVALALAPPSVQPAPGWGVRATMRYEARGDARWLWALERE
ncbi:MAG: 16S rRNA (guanine(527)-N(7))-methyltransferase RsmG [Desulfovibrionaceae bacterium]